MKFIDALTKSLEIKQSRVCVGLDSRYDRIPETIRKNATIADAIFSFNKHVIDATKDIAVAYKMNIAFYGGFGNEGLEGLRRTNEYLQSLSNTISLADYKRSEIGEGVKMLRKEVFDWLQFTCMMINPWFGADSIEGLLPDEKHGVCVYVHDSNPTAKEFQDLTLRDGTKVYEAVARHIVKHWNASGNIFVEVGATYPNALKQVRKIVGANMPILTSGIGSQGGKIINLQGVAGKNGNRLIVNSSRGIIFAGEGKKDYFMAVRQAALDLRNQSVQM